MNFTENINANCCQKNIFNLIIMGSSCCCMVMAFGALGGALFGLSVLSKKKQTPEEKERAEIEKEVAMARNMIGIWNTDPPANETEWDD